MVTAIVAALPLPPAHGEAASKDPDQALLDALYRVEGKAEIVNGRIVILPMTGVDPADAAFEIAVSLRQHVRRTRSGHASTDGLAFIVKLPRRRSFAPDAAYTKRALSGMKFADGAPDFAVEVRSAGDSGARAEKKLARKRADYFAAGTLVVWDVDLRSAEVVRVFRHGDAETPAAVYRRGAQAEAEPAVPGWTMAVDDLFAA